MITVSDAATSVLAGSFTYQVRCSSWLGATLLASEVPVSSGAENGDRATGVADRVTLRVPLKDSATGVNWSPIGDLHPLAANGQRLRIELGIGVGDADAPVEWVQRGEYVITDSDTEGDSVAVQCASLLWLVEEAKLVTPLQPTGTLKSAVRSLVEPAVPVVFDAALVDRAVPAGMVFDNDRIEALNEICEAWPADYRMASEGYLYLYPDTAGRTPVTTISGTVVEISGGSTRRDAYNAVVARGTDASGAQIQAVQYDTSGGPKSYGGPFSPFPVPFFFPSPLLTTVAQAKAAATTTLARLQRRVAREFEIEMVPDPRLQLGDVVTVEDELYTGLGEIERLQLPYDPEGSMYTVVRAVTA